MKKIKIISGAILCGWLVLATQSCKKNTTSVQNPLKAAEKTNETSRMWTAGKQLYAVGHNSIMQAQIYPLSAPPLLTPGTPTPLCVGATTVTQVTGVAFVTGTIVISTSPTSNFPNQLLIYNSAGPYTSPTMIPCADISDVEFNEYDGKLYGISSNTAIVRIFGVGTTALNLAPVVPVGSKICGLCNYNGLLSYCISDATSAADNFYSYNPASPAATAPLFSTDWGTGHGGMQYCSGFGWEMVNPNDNHKSVSSTYVPTGFSLIPGGLYRISDLTSN
jgi:hypothetical protein